MGGIKHIRYFSRVIDAAINLHACSNAYLSADNQHVNAGTDEKHTGLQGHDGCDVISGFVQLGS
jgi:hypothetical protein